MNMPQYSNSYKKKENKIKLIKQKKKIKQKIKM